jgi:hypothetical protein
MAEYADMCDTDLFTNHPESRFHIAILKEQSGSCLGYPGLCVQNRSLPYLELVVTFELAVTASLLKPPTCLLSN